MPSEADFLRAILADPDADGPRLVYADWRDECDDPARGEFIRVQCALASMAEPERAFHPLAAREMELEQAHRDDWLRPLELLLGPPRPTGWRRWTAAGPRWRAEFRRGFVEKLTLDVDLYLEHAARLDGMMPLRELVCLGPPPPDAPDRLAACPRPAVLSSFSIRLRPPSLVEFDQLIDCPFLSDVRSFTVASDIEPGCVAVLAMSSLLKRLRGLHLLDAPRLDDFAALPLFEAPAAQELEDLSFVNTGLDLNDSVGLIARPPLANLRFLSLSGSRLMADSLVPLLHWLPEGAHGLDLSRTGIDPFTVASLAHSPALRRIRFLNLAGNRIDDAAALALADSPNLLASTRLDLRDNPIGPRVKDALRIRCGHHVLV